MKKALLIIDVQKSSVTKPSLITKIEKLQNEYEDVFISLFTNKQSPLLSILMWNGYNDESLAFTPKQGAIIYEKTGYSSYLNEMKAYNEIHICGFDTDACVYKTAMDVVENNIRPIILKDYCFSENQDMHEMGIKLLERNIGKHNIV